ncbi:hypothetical protein M409DRAFT_32949, partial [Zasmidium cellare ATCC 36951]
QTQLATCMMLCVYDVFDEKECQWRLHMNGARHLFRALSQRQGVRSGNDFLMTWFLYHEVFGRLSQSPDQTVCTHSRGSATHQTIQSCIDKWQIIGSIGCSMEMLGLIDAIDNARISHQPKSKMSPHMYEHKAALERQLETLKQHDSGMNSIGEDPTCQTAATAELYRLAGLLYLHQVLPRPDDQLRRNQNVEAAFSLLRSMKTCTSPWPLFTLACEANTDDRRTLLLDVLDRMDETRKIGNVFSLRHIIEQVWKQTDLRSKPLQWWTMFNLETAGPWF